MYGLVSGFLDENAALEKKGLNHSEQLFGRLFT